MSLVILVPVLDRPERIEPFLASIVASTPKARVVFVADTVDEREHQALEDAGAEWFIFAGNYAAKINEAVERTEEELLFLGADDLDFKLGWFESAWKVLGDTGAEVIGTNDLCNPRTMRGEHATHFLVRRSYAERPTQDGGRGPLCELYRHNCVDDELLATATVRGVYAFAPDSIVQHLHPMAGHPGSETHRKALSSLRADKRLWSKRQAAFGWT